MCTSCRMNCRWQLSTAWFHARHTTAPVFACALHYCCLLNCTRSGTSLKRLLRKECAFPSQRLTAVVGAASIPTQHRFMPSDLAWCSQRNVISLRTSHIAVWKASIDIQQPAPPAQSAHLLRKTRCMSLAYHDTWVLADARCCLCLCSLYYPSPSDARTFEGTAAVPCSLQRLSV